MSLALGDVFFCKFGKGESEISMRIKEHPILGAAPIKRKVSFTFDGKVLEGLDGEPIAVALKENGVMIHRHTAKKNQPRGVFCAIGCCTDCVMVVDGKPNTRTCITPLQEGMVVQTQYGAGAGEVKHETL